MKRMRVLYMVAVIVCSFASRANAQGSVSWACGYPQAGTSAGSIVVQGTASPDCGWMLDPAATVTYWPEGGGVAQTANMVIGESGNWSLTITGLTPGATYNVVVQVVFGNLQMMTQATVAPDPATATAASCPP
jgi:hypothetical protein